MGRWLWRIVGVAELELLASAAIKLFGVPVIVWRDDPTGAPGYHLLMPRESVTKVWAGLMAIAAAGGRFGEAEAAARSAGRLLMRPESKRGGRCLGSILTTPFYLRRRGRWIGAVSFTKGCYPGQEIVARMHARQVVAKQIVGLKFAGRCAADRRGDDDR